MNATAGIPTVAHRTTAGGGVLPTNRTPGLRPTNTLFLESDDRTATMSGTTPSGILEEMTVEEVRELDPGVVVLGIGSTEPHGEHLPYGTDVYQVEGICRRAVPRANENGASVLLYPVLPIGNNVNFKEYPFACRIGVDTLKQTVLDIVEALEEDGVRKIVLVNGHGGNPATLRAALREHAGRGDPGEGAFVCLTSTNRAAPEDATAEIEHSSDHGGESETSRMLYLRPDLVNEDEFKDYPTRESTLEELEEPDRVVWVKDWPSYLPESAGGETRESSTEKGKALVEGAADWLAEFLVNLDETPSEELPYPSE